VDNPTSPRRNEEMTPDFRGPFLNSTISTITFRILIQASLDGDALGVSNKGKGRGLLSLMEAWMSLNREPAIQVWSPCDGVACAGEEEAGSPVASFKARRAVRVTSIVTARVARRPSTRTA
jgi:hypothetical protein